MKYYLVMLTKNERNELNDLVQCGFRNISRYGGFAGQNTATQNRAMKKFEEAMEIKEGDVVYIKKHFNKKRGQK